MPKPDRWMPRLSDDRVIVPTQAALALKLITAMDLLRLKSIARLYARGLPADVAWDDLLQEAITRVLTGKRVKPDEIPMVTFLGGIMRSLRSDHLRRARFGLRHGESSPQVNEVLDPAADPERALIAADELEKIRLLFVNDSIALQIVNGLAAGLSADQIRTHNGIPRKDYDSARKRMRRCLLREGLTCSKN
jgi:DNA-directed RNA polymerase specialized sigma24 family protein